MERPEAYRWNSLGYHIQTNNQDNFLSTDFGLKEFNPPPADECHKSEKERIRGFELSKSDRFRYRTRYFTDSGIIGSKEFVSANYQRFKNLFESKREKKPKPVKGLDGMYSLKRLSEVI